MLNSLACLKEGTDIQLRVSTRGSKRGLYKCLANLNSKGTANTLSGTDSSHLVKKLWSQILLGTERNNSYTDRGRWWCLGCGMCLFVCTSM